MPDDEVTVAVFVAAPSHPLIALDFDGPTTSFPEVAEVLHIHNDRARDELGWRPAGRRDNDRADRDLGLWEAGR